MQFRYSADRGACRLGHLRQCAGFTESPGVHGRGERLEIGLPGQLVVEGLELFGGVSNCDAGSHERGAPQFTSAAAGELHLGAQTSHPGALKIGQRPEFGRLEELVRRRGRGRISFGLSGRERPGAT